MDVIESRASSCMGQYAAEVSHVPSVAQKYHTHIWAAAGIRNRSHDCHQCSCTIGEASCTVWVAGAKCCGALTQAGGLGGSLQRAHGSGVDKADHLPVTAHDTTTLLFPSA
eukprot:5637351-Amphidinium_carterae.2